VSAVWLLARKRVIYIYFLHAVNLCLIRHLQLEAILATHSQQPVQLPTPEGSSMVGLLVKHVEKCLVGHQQFHHAMCTASVRLLTKRDFAPQSRLLTNVEAEPLVRAAWEHCFAVAPRSMSEVDAGAILHGKRRRSERY
jgi:hypothetical protein